MTTHPHPLEQLADPGELRCLLSAQHGQSDAYRATGGDGQKARRWLERLVELKQAEDLRAGNAKTFRVSLTRTHLTNPTNPTNPFPRSTSQLVTPNDEPDEPTKLDTSTVLGSSGFVMGGDESNPPAVEAVRRVRRVRHPLEGTPSAGGLAPTVPTGSSWDAADDDDDPAWGPRPEVQP